MTLCRETQGLEPPLWAVQVIPWQQWPQLGLPRPSFVLGWVYPAAQGGLWNATCGQGMGMEGWSCLVWWSHSRAVIPFPLWHWNAAQRISACGCEQLDPWEPGLGYQGFLQKLSWEIGSWGWRSICASACHSPVQKTLICGKQGVDARWLCCF